MIRLVVAIAAATLAWGAASAQAQAVRTIAEEPRPEVSGDPNRRVCRVQEVTGSRLRKGKSCRTAREWSEQDLQTRLAVRELRRPQDSSVAPAQRRQTPPGR